MIENGFKKSFASDQQSLWLSLSLYDLDYLNHFFYICNAPSVKSGLNLDLDPDVVAAMDSDFDFSDPENELEDDFIQIANGYVIIIFYYYWNSQKSYQNKQLLC